MGDSLITAGILAVVALSEGVRRLSPGTLVLERVGARGWRVARTLELGSGMHLLSWCLPCTAPLVLAGTGQHDALSQRRAITRLRARARRVHGNIAALRVIGLMVLATLIVGVPLAVSRWGTWGLLITFEALLVLCLVQAAAAWIALMRAGAPSERAGAAAIKLVWPFTAPGAAQLVHEQIASGVPPFVAARELLGDADFLSAIRTRAYDALHSSEPRALLDVYDRATLQSFLDRPLHTNGPYCPRCATVYRAGSSLCAECEVSLLGAAEPPSV